MYRSAGTLRAAILATAVPPAFIVLGLVKGGLIVAFVLAGLLAVLAWRIWHWGIRVRADGVQVVTLLVTRTVRWDEIEKFYVGKFSSYPFAAYVLLRDGRKLVSAGISTSQPGTEGHRRQVQGPVDELNAMLADWREARSAS
jgi:hypothetical protein